mmetsp:Transcript_70076/g.160666  ORF Transcript_70076/g.160666 Transcript_70076/m.160666 type:complete len:227 (+) Transcript_70076:2528-3208(+)
MLAALRDRDIICIPPRLAPSEALSLSRRLISYSACSTFRNRSMVWMRHHTIATPPTNARGETAMSTHSRVCRPSHSRGTEDVATPDRQSQRMCAWIPPRNLFEYPHWNGSFRRWYQKTRAAKSEMMMDDARGESPSERNGSSTAATLNKVHAASTLPVQMARGCREIGSRLKANTLVPTEKMMKRAARRIVGIAMNISGIPKGVHADPLPWNHAARLMGSAEQSTG